MEINNICAGMRVLYKKNTGNWLVGEINDGHAIVGRTGILLPILTEKSFRTIAKQAYTLSDDIQIIYVPLTSIFFDSFPIQEGIKEYSEYFMTKEDYIRFIESEDFDKRSEQAYVSDGEYGYYPVNKYTKAWLEKQPFDYIVRSVS